MNRTFFLTVGSGVLVWALLLSGCSGANEVSPVSTAVPTAAQIFVGDVCCPPDAATLTVVDATAEDLTQALPQLPQLLACTKIKEAKICLANEICFYNHKGRGRNFAAFFV